VAVVVGFIRATARIYELSIRLKQFCLGEISRASGRSSTSVEIGSCILWVRIVSTLVGVYTLRLFMLEIIA